MARMRPRAWRSGAVMWTASEAMPQPERQARGCSTSGSAGEQAGGGAGAQGEAIARFVEGAAGGGGEGLEGGEAVADEIAGDVDAQDEHAVGVAIEELDCGVDDRDQAGGAGGGDHVVGTSRGNSQVAGKGLGCLAERRAFGSRLIALEQAHRIHLGVDVAFGGGKDEAGT